MLCFASTEKFYQHRLWKEFRLEILSAKGNRCQACGATPDKAILHVDHVKARSKCPELSFDVDNMQVLCETCNLGKGTKGFRFKGITKDQYVFDPSLAPFLADLPLPLNSARRAAIFLKESIEAFPIEFIETLAVLGCGNKARKKLVFDLNYFVGVLHRAANMVRNSEAGTVREANAQFQESMEDPERVRIPKEE